MKGRGYFITMEGLDGSGKTTNVAVVERFLEQKKVPYIKTREPGGTDIGEKIRNIVLHSKDDICDHTELLLIFAARAQHIAAIIEPALSKGVCVLCDRFTDATYAYQGGGRRIDIGLIQQLEQHAIANMQPDITLLLDVPIEVGAQRAQARSTPDRFEREKMAFKHRVRTAYLARAKQYINRMHIINANQSREDVAHQIEMRLCAFFKQNTSS